MRCSLNGHQDGAGVDALVVVLCLFVRQAMLGEVAGKATGRRADAGAAKRPNQCAGRHQRAKARHRDGCRSDQPARDAAQQPTSQDARRLVDADLVMLRRGAGGTHDLVLLERGDANLRRVDARIPERLERSLGARVVVEDADDHRSLLHAGCLPCHPRRRPLASRASRRRPCKKRTTPRLVAR